VNKERLLNEKKEKGKIKELKLELERMASEKENIDRFLG